MLTLITDPSVKGRLSAEERARLRTRLGRMIRAAWLAERMSRPWEVSIRLTDDQVIHELNRDYRQKDRPTDVLAFAMREAAGEGGELLPDALPDPLRGTLPEPLGDIVISVETAGRQAKRGLFHEILFLSAHGLCHLLGYDHRTDAEEAVMNQRMKALMGESGRSGRTQPA